ncbi:MAG: MarR family winged helix-turn-helix transcriptional regulator [Thermomicrobiales bacterium]|nr:MarR family winged helix-turn-helix transcriptional regulator [Thermomicrobiales bacterium]
MSKTISTTPDAAMAVWLEYSTIHQHLMSHLARELNRETGLSEADYQILDAVADRPDGCVRALELRWILQWEKSRLSHQIARMIARGLLDRRACTEDARSQIVVLTTDGRDAALHARMVREASIERLILNVLPDEVLDGLAEATSLLADALERAADADPECRAARTAARDETSRPGDGGIEEGCLPC